MIHNFVSILLSFLTSDCEEKSRLYMVLGYDIIINMKLHNWKYFDHKILCYIFIWFSMNYWCLVWIRLSIDHFSMFLFPKQRFRKNNITFQFNFDLQISKFDIALRNTNLYLFSLSFHNHLNRSIPILERKVMTKIPPFVHNSNSCKNFSFSQTF